MYLDVDALSVVGRVSASLATLFFLHTLQLGIQEIAVLACTSCGCPVRMSERERETVVG